MNLFQGVIIDNVRASPSVRRTKNVLNGSLNDPLQFRVAIRLYLLVVHWLRLILRHCHSLQWCIDSRLTRDERSNRTITHQKLTFRLGGGNG